MRKIHHQASILFKILQMGETGRVGGHCIFQKLSKSKSDTQKGMDSKVQSVFALPVHDSEVDLDAEAYLAKHSSPIPPVFETALKLIQPGITGEMLKYWWRAQAAGYITRLNQCLQQYTIPPPV